MFGSTFCDFSGFGSIPYISEMTDQEALNVIYDIKNQYEHIDSDLLKQILEDANVDIYLLSPQVEDMVNQGW